MSRTLVRSGRANRFERGRRLAESSLTELHALRKAIKKLRYGVEYLAGLYPEQPVKDYRRACTAAVASGQNGASTGAAPSAGCDRPPQVRAITSGSSSMAMSQRTPSH